MHIAQFLTEKHQLSWGLNTNDKTSNAKKDVEKKNKLELIDNLLSAYGTMPTVAAGNFVLATGSYKQVLIFSEAGTAVTKLGIQ